MCQLYCCSACENNYNTCESFDAHNNDTIKPIEAKTIDLPIVVEPIEAKTIDLPIVVEAIEAKTSYKHCIDNIGASISLVYAKNWQNILHIFVKL
jgi:PII-like signaling protein